MAALIDPRIKLHMLKEAYHKLDPRTSEKKIEIVKNNLELLIKSIVQRLQKVFFQTSKKNFT